MAKPKTEISKADPYTRGWHIGFDAGVAAERERIVALLGDCELVGSVMSEIVALIRKEPEG